MCDPATTVAHLVKNVDNIVGIKEASGDISVGAKINASGATETSTFTQGTMIR